MISSFCDQLALNCLSEDGQFLIQADTLLGCLYRKMNASNHKLCLKLKKYTEYNGKIILEKGKPILIKRKVREHAKNFCCWKLEDE
jgi:hypothetical protein